MKEIENKKNNKLILKKKKISLKNNFEESAIALNIIKNSKNEISPNDKISNNIDISLNNEMKKEKNSTNESGKENYNEGDFKKQNSFKLEESNKNEVILNNNNSIDINEIKVIFKKEEQIIRIKWTYFSKLINFIVFLMIVLDYKLFKSLN